MTDWNDLPPDQQRQELARQMEHLRGHHVTALSNSVEALAQARELLVVPVYDPSRHRNWNVRFRKERRDPIATLL
ncbi:hypothetical protein ACRAWG_10440 [Methylobacterium sp. P31]